MREFKINIFKLKFFLNKKEKFFTFTSLQETKAFGEDWKNIFLLNFNF